MFINQKLQEIHLKIVYYGPALSGKTSNLEFIYAHTNPQMRSQLVSIKTREDRTLYFDYLQLELGRIKGLKPKFSLYTVPGQVYYAGSRKLVLEGADGVVFVADSQPQRLSDNKHDLATLEKHLHEMGRSPETFPLVLQCNKQDVAGAIPINLLQARLGRNGLQSFPAVATQGRGVFESLKAIVNRILQEL